MQKSIKNHLPAPSFWLSLLMHSLLLLYFSFVLVSPVPKNQKSPHLYVPSYVYTGKTPRQQQTASASSIKTQSENAGTQGLTKKTDTTRSETEMGVRPKSMLAASFSALQQMQQESITSSLQTLKDIEPIYLVGDYNQVADPLVKLLGKALSANFKYPKMAGEFGIKGRVVIGMTLHPEGYFSDVQILRSSQHQDLDAAALYAVNQAPRVKSADRFLSAPKRFVIGFVFS